MRSRASSPSLPREEIVPQLRLSGRVERRPGKSGPRIEHRVVGQSAIGLGSEANRVRRGDTADPNEWMDGGDDLGDISHVRAELHFGRVGLIEQADRRVQGGFEETGQAGRMMQGSAQRQLSQEADLLLDLWIELPDSSQATALRR